MARYAFIVPADLPGPSGGLAYNQRVLAQWRTMGLDVEEVPVPGAWPRPAPADRRILAQRLRQHRRVLIDGIIASAAPEELRVAAAAGTRVAMLVHLPLPAESGLTPGEQQRLAAGEAAAVSAAHVVVCTSGWAHDDLQSRYGLGQVSVAEPGVDPAALAAGSLPARLLFLGAVTPRKNPLGLLQALGVLTALPWSVVIAGPEGQDPGYAGRVRAAADALPDGRAAVIGPVSGQQLETLWGETDLLVLPSLAETYGMVVTEALARGIPALVGAGTGAQDALCGDPTGPRSELPTPGAALDPYDPSAWSDLLRAWSSDAHLRQQWRRAAQAHRARLRTWSHAAQDLRTAIEW
ncbi:glycosyltransferase family 4 protein [Nesterenkonia sp. LB17]|uniref:glycosyltransferase family 4 protein n=1 Tax=Nesterenkonia sp. LB17 TaxID=2901230 RepID=UPI001F4CA2DA|nr:glycosyltransferase family 4 protein [Nesterenkonia sp. LB17]MCH8566511.1 glycosyltransferase family 4 protein [Nesterenkonia sp. LB17]